MERCELTFSGALPSSLFPGSFFGVSCLVGRCVVCLGLCMNVDAVFVVIDCCYRLYDRFVVKLHACLPEKIDSYLITATLFIKFPSYTIASLSSLTPAS